MTSILTNISAMTALQTLRTIDGDLTATQGKVGSGLRVSTASDNAAYWSISTTMRSDNDALSAVSDALGLGAAKVETAYAGMESVVDILDEFKAKLVAASEEGVDKAKVQDELDQLKQQVLTVAQAASFSGQNWLNTDIENIYDKDLSTTTLTTGFVRGEDNQVSVERMNVALSDVALFNSTGGGLLQKDARDVTTVGGMRQFSPYPDWDYGDKTIYFGEEGTGWMYPEQSGGNPAILSYGTFPASEPIDFNVPGAEIRFDLILDKEMDDPSSGGMGTNPLLNELPGPYFEGAEFEVVITKATVDTYLPALNGVISTNTQFANLLNKIFEAHGAEAYASTGWMVPSGANYSVHDPESLRITTRERHSSGSYVGVANVSSVGVSTAGLAEDFDYGTRGSGMILNFQELIVHEDGDDEDGIDISFTFSLNGEPATAHTFNRTYVNELLGKDSGKVASAEEMATLLHSLLDTEWPDLVIEATPDGNVLIKSDPAVDREWGTATSIAFNNIRASNEPLPTIDFLTIDVEQNPDMVDAYITYLETASSRIVAGTATLGAIKSRIDMQTEFTDKLMSMMDKGVGRLVDADMNEESTRLKALETQQQLAIQALSIANSASETMMQLFR